MCWLLDVARSRRGADDERMTSGKDATPMPGEEWVVFASFDTARHGEHMFVKLGRGFRSDVRKGGAVAVVVTQNADESLKLRQSRAVTISGYIGTLIRLSTFWLIGFMGLSSAAKGVGHGLHAAKMHQGHVGSDEHLAHQIIGDAGPSSAIVLVRSKDPATKQAVVAAAAVDGLHCWDGSVSDFLAELDPGPSHDWVRTALGEPPRNIEVGPDG